MPEAQVRLRTIAEADLPDYVEWLNDPEVTQFTQIEGPLTLEHEREWFRRITGPDSGVRNWAIEVDGRHIGNCALHLDESGEIAGFGIVIGDKTQWGKGHGTAALREVLRIGFEEMDLQRVHLTALAENTRAIRCYEKCGFRHEGLRRRHFFKRGKWLDVVCMGILREEWEARQTEVAASAEETTIRSYRPTDYESVVALWREVGFTVDDRDSAEGLARYVLRNPGLFLIAEARETAIGTVLGSWDGRRSIVYRMAVHPGWQRRGVGTQLMVEAERRLAAAGARSVALLAWRDDQRAVGFYEALGYEKGEGVAFMMKRLDEGEESGDGRDCC
jgi:RimJ/RimL family protein N-acetyltransferase